MRVPTYGAVFSLAAFLGVGAFICVLIVKAPPTDGWPEPRRTAQPARRPPPPESPTDPDELEEWLERNPDSSRDWMKFAAARHEQGRADDARAAWVRAEALYRDRAERGAESRMPGANWYNTARCRARLGDADGALEALQQAVKAGWGDPDRTKADPNFESLGEDPRFQELIASMPHRAPPIVGG